MERTVIYIWRGVWNKALSDFWCNVKFSSLFTTEYKEIWKENLVIYQKSLKALSRHPCIYDNDDDDEVWECRRGTAENRALLFLVFVAVDYDVGKFAVMALNLLGNSCTHNLAIVVPKFNVHTHMNLMVPHNPFFQLISLSCQEVG